MKKNVNNDVNNDNVLDAGRSSTPEEWKAILSRCTESTIDLILSSILAQAWKDMRLTAVKDKIRAEAESFIRQDTMGLLSHFGTDGQTYIAMCDKANEMGVGPIVGPPRVADRR